MSCGRLIVKTCYPQACCKLFQQVVTSLQMTNCLAVLLQLGNEKIFFFLEALYEGYKVPVDVPFFEISYSNTYSVFCKRRLCACLFFPPLESDKFLETC